jgi:hypothetical protein
LGGGASTRSKVVISSYCPKAEFIPFVTGDGTMRFISRIITLPFPHCDKSTIKIKDKRVRRGTDPQDLFRSVLCHKYASIPRGYLIQTGRYHPSSTPVLPTKSSPPQNTSTFPHVSQKDMISQGGSGLRGGGKGGGVILSHFIVFLSIVDGEVSIRSMVHCR